MSRASTFWGVYEKTWNPKTGWLADGWNCCNPAMMRQGKYGHPAANLFIIFVDALFTILFERSFTKVFDAIAQIAAIPCLYRACNAD